MQAMKFLSLHLIFVGMVLQRKARQVYNLLDTRKLKDLQVGRSKAYHITIRVQILTVEVVVCP